MPAAGCASLDAGIAIQFYGTATEHIVANNRSWRTDGYRAYGFSYTGGVQPNLYLQFLGNEIREGNAVENSDLGILVDAGCRNVLLRRNQTERCLVPLLDNRAR